MTLATAIPKLALGLSGHGGYCCLVCNMMTFPDECKVVDRGRSMAYLLPCGHSSPDDQIFAAVLAIKGKLTIGEYP